jgi:hypothetical protein
MNETEPPRDLEAETEAREYALLFDALLGDPFLDLLIAIHHPEPPPGRHVR